MKSRRGNFVWPVPLLSAMAGALLAMGAQAKGEIVYSGIQNLTFDRANPASVDLNHDGFTDLTFSLRGAYPDGSQPFVQASSTAFLSSEQPFGQVYTTSGVGESVMDQGGNNLHFASGYGATTLSSIGTVFLDFLFIPSGISDADYGWLRFNYDSSTNTDTIIDWAYNSLPGQDILTGQTVAVVPEPSASAGWMSAAALLCGSVLLWRRREQRLDGAG